LHGLRGSPYSFVGGLRFAAVADWLIHSRRVHPFIAVLPPAGRSAQFDGEWTGPWERYVVQDVLPWSERHLPLTATPGTRTLAGFSAGAYGSVDIGLRHPGLFGTLESWSGYFKSPKDGSLASATAAERMAHDPLALLPAAAAELRAGHVRIFLSAGRGEPKTLLAARTFARELSGLGLQHVLDVTAGGHHGRAWRAVLPSGLVYALAR
jgi:enterochelin esterase-like enzyme